MEAAASEFGYCLQQQQQPPQSQRTPERRASGDHFIVEDLLDFSNEEDGVVNDDTHNSNSNSISTDSSPVVTPVDSCNSSFSGNNDPIFPPPADFGSGRCFSDTHFSGELCVPYDELAELEWLSNIVDDDSFSREELHNLQLISGMSAMKTRPDEGSETRFYHTDPPRSANPPSPMFGPEMPVPGKARSKRSRAAPCNWTSRLMVVSPKDSGSPDPAQSVHQGPEHHLVVKPVKSGPKKKSGSGSGSGLGSGSDLPNGEVRKCLHCATDKTPQWRTGPMGPKTLCNACGVRYKSGRLVPEYRPAASPTFVLTKHSNSHRKVMELRRQKEMMKHHQMQHTQQYHQQLIHHSNASSMMFDPSNGEDYLIHQHIGPDYRQLI